jgi:hypothetical protein
LQPSPAGWRAEARFADPVFWGALALLALNDHVLKGSRMAPAALTGKLSDVAGLLVAPLVLAWLLRIRTRRGWAAVHAAVGLGFALVQAEPVARGLEELARGLGVGARLWADPSDLLALPALALSHARFGPARRTAPPPLAHSVGLGALVLCTATPAPGGDPPPRYPFPPAGVLETDAFVRHTGSQDLAVRIHRLRDEVTVDCDGLLDEPERMLEDGDFGEERSWTLARGDAVPLWDRRGGAIDRACYAVRFAARGREWLITWRHGAPPVRPIDIRLDPNEPAEADAIRVSNDGEAPPSVPEGVTVRRR